MSNSLYNLFTWSPQVMRFRPQGTRTIRFFLHFSVASLLLSPLLSGLIRQGVDPQRAGIGV